MEEAKNAGKIPFYGFSFDFTMADSTGLNAIGQNYHNDLNWYFAPTWKFGPRFLRNSVFKTAQVSAYFAVTQNLSGVDESNFGSSVNAGPHGTCGNVTPNANGTVIPTTNFPYCNPAANGRRTDYSDLRLTFSAPKIYTIPKANIHINPSLRFVFPTSLESQFATLVMAISPSVGMSRSFWKDRISLGAGFGVTKNFHTKSTPEIAGSNNAGQPSTPQGNNFFDGAYRSGISNFYSDPSRIGQVGGYNVNVALLGSFTGAIQITDKWSFDVLYILIGNFPYGHSCMATTQGLTTDTCTNGDQVAANSGSSVSRPGNHDVQVFWATLAYQPIDWLGLSLAWINWAPLQNSDSTYRQGIISSNYDAYTTVQLGVTVTLDKLGAKFFKN